MLDPPTSAGNLVPVRHIGRHRSGPSFQLREASEHVLRRHRFLTLRAAVGFTPTYHTTLIVYQVVVVVSQSERRSTLIGVGRIGSVGRVLILLVHRLFGGILLLEFEKILSTVWFS